MNTQPKDNQVKISNHFTNTLDYWHTLYDGSTFLSLHMADRKKIVLDLVRAYAKGTTLKILDMGCGTGILSKALLDEGHSVASLDCSEQMLEKLQDSLKDSPYRTFLGTFLENVADTSFPAKEFDAIICIGVFQYQLHDDDLVREIGRILNKGGFCIFTLPNLLRLNYLLDPLYYFRFLARAIQRLLPKVIGKDIGSPNALSGEVSDTLPYDKKYFLWQLNDLLEKQGLMIKEIVGFGFGPLTFWGRQIISDEISLKISTRLNQKANRYSLLKVFCNRWVFVVEKI
ncbi:MAG: class I SAM-dependent methyltransferase [Deltaproteobacteria bacterium]|nr:class I SAM-dependent methyltransferase [Deltaproteobacteria bacterium]